MKFRKLDETTVHTRTIEGDDAQIRYTSPTGTKVTTSIRRLHLANSSKEERETYDKEHAMCKVIADNKINITHRESASLLSGTTFDTFFGDRHIPCDLKQTGDTSNIVKYAKKAVKKQGAQLVVYAIEDDKIANMDDVFKAFDEAIRKYDVKIQYYKMSENVLRRYKIQKRVIRLTFVRRYKAFVLSLHHL